MGGPPRWVVLAVVLGGAAAVLQCNNIQFPSATFDISPLIRSSSEASYVITDGDIWCTPGVEANYTYYVNVCADVTTLPPDPLCATKAGPVVQYDPLSPADGCWSGGGRSPADQSVALINPNDPSVGVKVVYANGDVCNHDAHGLPIPTPRQTSLLIYCDPTQLGIPSRANEVAHCQYEIEFHSIFGCPLSCPMAGRAVCGGNGFCGFDYTGSAPHCFCYTGSGGDDCTHEPDPAVSGGTATAVIALVIVLVIFTVVLGGVAAFLLHQLRQFRGEVQGTAMMRQPPDTSPLLTAKP